MVCLNILCASLWILFSISNILAFQFQSFHGSLQTRNHLQNGEIQKSDLSLLSERRKSTQLMAKKKSGKPKNKKSPTKKRKSTVIQEEEQESKLVIEAETVEEQDSTLDASKMEAPAEGVEDLDVLLQNEEVAETPSKQEKSRTNFEPLEAVNPIASVPDAVTALQMEVEASKGKYRVDFETGQPIKLPVNPRDKMAACFPEATPQMIEQHRLPVTADYKMITVALDDAINAGNATLTDFIVANRDLFGIRTRKVLTSLKLKAQSQFNKNLALYYNNLRNGLMFRENVIHGPFRQLMYEAEERLAPWMGSSEVDRYVGRDKAEYAATWLLLKAAVAEWEKRRAALDKQVETLETEGGFAPYMMRGIKRQLENANYMTAVVQQMSLGVAGKQPYFEELPLEMQFLEKALTLSTTSEVRKFAIKEFCPENNISNIDLIRKIRRMLVSIEFLSQKTYRNIYFAIQETLSCLTDGTEESFDPYKAGYEDIKFETYKITTSDDFNTLSQEPTREDDLGQDFTIVYDAIKQSFGLPISTQIESDDRPRDLGWINLLDDDFEETLGVEEPVREKIREKREKIMRGEL